MDLGTIEEAWLQRTLVVAQVVEASLVVVPSVVAPGTSATEDASFVTHQACLVEVVQSTLSYLSSLIACSQVSHVWLHRCYC